MLFCRNKKFKKRDCGVKMRLVPYGGGWTDVHMAIITPPTTTISTSVI